MSTKLSGSFTGTGTSAEAYVARGFNASVQGGATATITLERSFDDGSTWEVFQTWEDTNVSLSYEETERKTKYRFQCTDYTSGTATYRLGSNGIS